MIKLVPQSALKLDTASGSGSARRSSTHSPSVLGVYSLDREFVRKTGIALGAQTMPMLGPAPVKRPMRRGAGCRDEPRATPRVPGHVTGDVVLGQGDVQRNAWIARLAEGLVKSAGLLRV